MATENFQREIGISQRLLADWLGISRDLLAQYELRRRDIPTAALLRLGQLVTILVALPQSLPAIEDPIHYPKKVKSTQRKIRLLDLEINRLTFHLAQLEDRMVVWRKALSLCKRLMTEPPFDDKVFTLAVDMFYQKTWLAWNDHGPRERKIMEFYRRQKTEEEAFMEQIAEEYATGKLE